MPAVHRRHGRAPPHPIAVRAAVAAGPAWLARPPAHRRLRPPVPPAIAALAHACGARPTGSRPVRHVDSAGMNQGPGPNRRVVCRAERDREPPPIRGLPAHRSAAAPRDTAASRPTGLRWAAVGRLAHARPPRVELQARLRIQAALPLVHSGPPYARTAVGPPRWRGPATGRPTLRSADVVGRAAPSRAFEADGIGGNVVAHLAHRVRASMCDRIAVGRRWRVDAAARPRVEGRR